MITAKIAEDLENYVEKHFPKLLKSSGLKLNIVSIGGKYNKEGILLEIGVVSEGLSPEQCRKFLVDRAAEGVDVAVDVDAPNTAMDLSITGLSSKKLKSLAKALPASHKAGDMYSGKTSQYILVGFSDKRDSFVIFDTNSMELKFATEKAFAKLKKV